MLPTDSCFMTCGCLPEVKVILLIKRSRIKDPYEPYCRFLNVFIVTEGGTKITSLMTGAVALRSDRHAIISAVAPPAERYRFEFRRAP